MYEEYSKRDPNEYFLVERAFGLRGMPNRNQTFYGKLNYVTQSFNANEFVSLFKQYDKFFLEYDCYLKFNSYTTKKNCLKILRLLYEDPNCFELDDVSRLFWKCEQRGYHIDPNLLSQICDVGDLCKYYCMSIGDWEEVQENIMNGLITKDNVAPWDDGDWAKYIFSRYELEDLDGERMNALNKLALVYNHLDIGVEDMLEYFKYTDDIYVDFHILDQLVVIGKRDECFSFEESTGVSIIGKYVRNIKNPYSRLQATLD